MMQVENAIFNVHRSVLARYSTVIQDLLDSFNENEAKDEADKIPLVMTGDSAAGWELLLGLQYDSPRINSESLSGEHLLLILPVAHKYCMEKIEADIVEELCRASTCDGSVDLVVASQIIESELLYQEGIQRLITSNSSLNLAQAKRIGVEATHTIMTALMDEMKQNLNFMG